MGGIAAIARAAGHRVTGADQGVYPPMSDQLAALGIDVIEGYDPVQLDLKPDVVIVGNVMSRGMPIIEALLNGRMMFMSGPEWLSREVLARQQVVAVADIEHHLAGVRQHRLHGLQIEPIARNRGRLAVLG